METVRDFIFWGSRIIADGDCSHEIKRCLLLGRKPMTNLDSVLKSRDVILPIKVHLVKTMVFPVVMYRCENWMIKKAECWRTDVVVLEKTLESPLDFKEIKPVNPKGNQSWIFIGRTWLMVLWCWSWNSNTLATSDAKSWFIRKDPEAQKDWRQEEKGTTEYEMVGWHPWLYGCDFEQAPGVGDGQGSLVCCSPWGRKDQWNWLSDMAEKYILFREKSVIISIILESCISQCRKIKTNYLGHEWTS